MNGRANRPNKGLCEKQNQRWSHEASYSQLNQWKMKVRMGCALRFKIIRERERKGEKTERERE